LGSPFKFTRIDQMQGSLFGLPRRYDETELMIVPRSRKRQCTLFLHTGNAGFPMLWFVAR